MSEYINLLRSLHPLPDELTGKVWIRPEVAREIAFELEVMVHARNTAQQRAEQAERERDEARELLSRIRAITTASLSPLDWTPKTGAEIAADMEGKPAILPPDFDIDAIMSNLAKSLSVQDVIHASLAKDNADGYLEDGEPNRAIPYLSEAIGYLIDALKGIQKGGAK